MSRRLPMPEVAAGVTEAILARWQVQPGQAFVRGDTLALVETDKASVDVTAEADGVLLRHLVEPGSTVQVGEDIALIGVASEAAGEPAVEPAVAAEPAGHRETPAVPSAAQAAKPVAAAAADTAPHGGRIFVSPVARRLADAAGIEVGRLAGTGPEGRIRRRDVEAAIAGRGDAAEFEAIPHSRMRKAIARALVESTNTVPHFYLRARIRVDDLLTLRAQLNAVEGVRISINDLVVKAAARALVLVPEMNVTWTDEAVRRYRTADLAIAMATEDGLVTPVVRGVEALGVSELSRRIKDLVARAASGGLKQHELEGGSFTISNLGMFGVREFDAIINPPHAGILAVGAAVQEPIVVDGVVQVATVMHVTLSVDHRPVDGAVGAKWLATFVQVMEDPVTLLV